MIHLLHRPGLSNAPVLDSRRFGALAFATLSVLYFASGVSNRIEAMDTLIFSGDAEVASFWSNPDARMLLYYRLNRLTVQGLAALGTDLNVYTVLGAIGALFAAGSVILMFSLLRQNFRCSMAASLAGALTLALSYGFLRYANEAEVYSGAIFLTLLSTRLLLRQFDYPDLTLRQSFFAGLLGAVAVGYYQPTALPLFFAASVLFFARHRFLQYVVYGAAGVGLYAIFLVLSLWAEIGRLPAAGDLADILGSRIDEFDPPELGKRSIFLATLAILHDFASTTWAYGLSNVELFMAREFPVEHYLSEKQIFAARNYPWIWVAAVTFFAVCAWYTYMAAAAFYAGNRARPDARVLFLLAWLMLASALNLLLNPGEEEVWLTCLPAMVALLTVYVYEPLHGRTKSLAAAVVLLFAHNSVGGIGLFHHAPGDHYAGSTNWVRQHGERGDWILRTGAPEEWADGMRILRYPIEGKPGASGRDTFFNFMFFYGNSAALQQWVGDKLLSPNEMLRTLKSSGGRLYILERALSPRPLPPGGARATRYKELVAFAEILRPISVLVADGPYGATYEVDKTRLPDSMPTP